MTYASLRESICIMSELLNFFQRTFNLKSKEKLHGLTIVRFWFDYERYSDNRFTGGQTVGPRWTI